MKKTFSLYLICSVCVLNLPGTIYKENMSEEIEELRDQIGRKLDIFILTSSTLSPLAPAICNLIVNLTNTPPCKTKEGQVDSNSSAFSHRSYNFFYFFSSETVKWAKPLTWKPLTCKCRMMSTVFSSLPARHLTAPLSCKLISEEAAFTSRNESWISWGSCRIITIQNTVVRCKWEMSLSGKTWDDDGGVGLITKWHFTVIYEATGFSNIITHTDNHTEKIHTTLNVLLSSNRWRTSAFRMETELSKSLSSLELSNPDEYIHEHRYKVCHPGNSLLHTWPLSTWRSIEGARVQYKVEKKWSIKGWGPN